MPANRLPIALHRLTLTGLRRALDLASPVDFLPPWASGGVGLPGLPRGIQQAPCRCLHEPLDNVPDELRQTSNAAAAGELQGQEDDPNRNAHDGCGEKDGHRDKHQEPTEGGAAAAVLLLCPCPFTCAGFVYKGRLLGGGAGSSLNTECRVITLATRC